MKSKNETKLQKAKEFLDKRDIFYIEFPTDNYK